MYCPYSILANEDQYMDDKRSSSQICAGQKLEWIKKKTLDQKLVSGCSNEWANYYVAQIWYFIIKSEKSTKVDTFFILADSIWVKIQNSDKEEMCQIKNKFM